jgi:hypothetical protein
MSAITPHIQVNDVHDCVELVLKACRITLPAAMAVEVGQLLVTRGRSHDPLWNGQLPVVTPSGKPIS